MPSGVAIGGKSIEDAPRVRMRLSRLRQALGRVRRSGSVQVGLILSSIFIVLSVGAPLFTRLDPTDMDMMNILRAPTESHIFGTDDFGRDLFSRVLYGGRISIVVGLVVAGITTLTGVTIGVLAGYYRRLDNPIMRVMDILMAFHTILLAIGIMAVLGPQLINIIIALVFPYTPVTARVVRGSVLSLREQEFVEAARSIGARDLRIILRHLLHNCLAPLLVQQTVIIAYAILAESGLSFLGVGVPPEVPTLGSILSDSRVFLRNAPWMSIFPGLSISLLVLGFNLLGDGLRDVLDPRLKL